MKSKLLVVSLGAILGLLIPLPVAVVAQRPDYTTVDQDSKPSPSIAMQGPNDQGSVDYSNQSSTAPAETNGVARISLINGNVSTQRGESSELDQDPKPSPSIAMQGPNDHGSVDYSNQSSTAPAETNGVARISLINGDVSTQRGESSEWSAAALNAPVLAGDRVSTGDQARTELQLDYANLLRLGEQSQANVNTLTRSQIQIQLGRGMANYSVLKNSDADAEIDTPNVAIRTDRRESSFRIVVTADDHTEVLVRRGEVEITTPQGGTRVTQGQFITVVGIGDEAQYRIDETPARDDWDQWNFDRDNVILNAASRRRTNDYYVGAEDLDSHGTWTEVPDYGSVWRPTVPVDWAPYRDGRWVDEPSWGWTWVSYDDWGWAPYHYGRWMQYDGAWAWWPGPISSDPFYRPIWAPAYVSFFGVGSGFGFGFGYGGWGSIGWLPLGPCDYFHPWWGRYGERFEDRDIREHNRGGFAPLHGGNRFSNVNLALHDQHFRGATTVSGREFGTGHMRPHPMNHAEFQKARFSTGKLPVKPNRESFSASGRPAAASTTRNVPKNQRFFSARGTAATQPRSFERGQPARSNIRHPKDGSTGNSSGAPRAGNTRPNSAPSNAGFRRFSKSDQNTVAQSRSTHPVNNSQRPEPRGSSNWGSGPRTGHSVSTPSRESGINNGGSWQRFEPMPRRPSTKPARPESTRQGQSYGRPLTTRPENRGSYGASGSSVPASRGYSSEGRGYSGSSRPPLNMRQPIVTPRSNGGGGDSGSPNGRKPRHRVVSPARRRRKSARKFRSQLRRRPFGT